MYFFCHIFTESERNREWEERGMKCDTVWKWKGQISWSFTESPGHLKWIDDSLFFVLSTVDKTWSSIQNRFFSLYQKVVCVLWVRLADVLMWMMRIYLQSCWGREDVWENQSFSVFECDVYHCGLARLTSVGNICASLCVCLSEEDLLWMSQLVKTTGRFQCTRSSSVRSDICLYKSSCSQL